MDIHEELDSKIIKNNIKNREQNFYMYVYL